MAKNPNKCVVKWCESLSTTNTSIGPVCTKHLGEEPENTGVATTPEDPNTLSISVAEIVKMKDGLT